MKHFILVCFALFITQFLQAQDNTILEGTYRVTGYFFHPTSSRDIDTTKTITHVSGSRYQVNFADLGGNGYAFQFDVDNSNNLTNWTPVGSTPALPSSGFMEEDNPGNFTFSGFVLPGQGDYNTSFYSNKYNPANQTFYMHYGYGAGSTVDSGYSRQIYEQWSFDDPFPPELHSFSPMSATSLAQITITGKQFSHIYAPSPTTVSFGNVYADSVSVVSDTVLKAWVSYGATGKLRVNNGGGIDSLDGFTFLPVSPVTDTQWNYIGTPGFSTGRGSFVNMARDKNNIPYVVYVDSSTSKAMVMKYTGATWVAVGLPVSAGRCSYTNILVDNNNLPVVVYADSTLGGNVSVKRFNGSAWVNVGVNGFAPWKSKYPVSICSDKNNVLYALSVDTLDDIYTYAPTVYKFNGTAWVILGQADIGTVRWDGVGMAMDTITNTPYILFADYNSPGNQGEATVMKFNGTSWVTVGQAGFTQTFNGIFYPDIKIDATGIPYVCFQEDNGFERMSVYKFTGGMWNVVGSPKFSKGRIYTSSLALDRNNNPLVAYRDGSYNQAGTIRTFSSTSSWETVGQRGFCPSYLYYSNSLAIDSNNIPMVAISDYYHGGKVSVLRFKPNRNTNDSLCAAGNISFVADNSNTGNTYRWQADAGSGYVNLVNSGTYNGVTTNSLIINAVPSSYYGYKYRCIITNAGVNDTGAVHQLHFINHWIGAVSNVWENPANWSCNSLPDANTDVLVNSGTVVINSNVIIRSLQVNTGVSLSIGTGFNLTVLH